jgi:hypothetical protein
MVRGSADDGKNERRRSNPAAFVFVRSSVGLRD